MKFGLFYAGELLHALTIGVLFSSLFLGGWRGPYAAQFPILGVVYLFIKAFFIYWVIMWIKYSLPRIRIDHMMSFNWKFLTPLALIYLMVIAVAQKVLSASSTPIYVIGMLAINLVVIWITFVLLQRRAHITRQQFEADRPLARPTEVGVSSTTG